MSEDIVDELREVARVLHKEITAVLGVVAKHDLETTVPWQGADEIVSLRLSLKEAEASRDEIIEECAKALDAEAELSPFCSTYESAAALVRALKSSPSQSPKIEG